MVFLDLSQSSSSCLSTSSESDESEDETCVSGGRQKQRIRIRKYHRRTEDLRKSTSFGVFASISRLEIIVEAVC